MTKLSGTLSLSLPVTVTVADPALENEAALLRAEIGMDFTLVTPGVRPRGASLDDQTRVLTPAEAVQVADGRLYPCA